MERRGAGLEGEGAAGALDAKGCSGGHGHAGGGEVHVDEVGTGHQTSSGFVSISWINVGDGGGSPLLHGKACFGPVNDQLQPIAPTYNTGTTVGTIIKTPKCAPVTNGALQSGVQLIDSTLTSVGHLKYLVTLTNTDANNYFVIGPKDGWTIQPTGASFEVSSTQPGIPGMSESFAATAGPRGPPGATGPAGPQGLAGPSGTGSLAGKNVMFWGDSLSSIFSNKWQTAFIAVTGANYYSQDARPGRTWGSMLEGYGASCPLASLSALGPWNPNTSVSTSSQCGLVVGGTLGNYGSYASPQSGYTLAQTLANVDVLVIALGTNHPNNLGSLADAYTAGTEHAAMNFALDAVYTANPTIHVIEIGPTFLEV